MRFYKSALTLLTAFVLVPVLVHPQPEAPAPKELLPYLSAEATEVTSAKLTLNSPQRDFFIAAWCERSAPQSETSRVVIVALAKAADGRKLAKKIIIRDAYAPTVEVRSEFVYKGSPVALVHTKSGAAATRIDAVGADIRGVHHLGKIEADYFDGLVMNSESYLVAHDDVSLLDVPKLYRWRGTAFEDDSQHHPEYYKTFLAELERRVDASKLAPAVQQRYSELRRLANY